MIIIITLPVFLCWFVSEPVDQFQPAICDRLHRGELALRDASLIQWAQHQFAPLRRKPGTVEHAKCLRSTTPRRNKTRKTSRKIRKTQENIAKSFENPCEVLKKKGLHRIHRWLENRTSCEIVPKLQTFWRSGVPIFNETQNSETTWYTIWLFNSSPWYTWPIEIDGLPINSMVIFHGKLWMS